MSAIAMNWLGERFPRRDEVGIAVLYCSYSMQEEQSREKLVAALLRQLVKREQLESEKVHSIYEECKSAKRRPNLKELASMLQHVAGSFSKAFVIVDALDECVGMEWSPLASELRGLQALCPALRLMLTFRPHVTIAEKMGEATTLHILADPNDLKHYVTMQLWRLSKHVTETAELRQEVVKGIVDAADGM
jgi:hypothetical protein